MVQMRLIKNVTTKVRSESIVLYAVSIQSVLLYEHIHDRTIFNSDYCWGTQLFNTCFYCMATPATHLNTLS